MIQRGAEHNPVSVEKLVQLFQNAMERLDTDTKQVCKSMVKIYAHSNGDCDLEVGVHINGNARHK